MAVKEINDFLNRVKEQGYSAKHEQSEYSGLDEIIISEEDFYHVRIDTRWIFNATFDDIMGYVKKDLENLKARHKR